MKRKKRILVATFVAFLVGFSAWRLFYQNENNSYVRTHYNKYEYRVPMRDGVHLFTAVYVPKGTPRQYPFLLTRTPFGVTPYGKDRYPARLGPTEAFDRAGYIFVFQDVRGRYQSEGQFVDVRPHVDHPAPGETDESTDMHDTVEWLLKNVQGNNGNVGIWGLSYPGFYVLASIIDSHPAIKAASPQAPITDLFRGDDFYHNGTFMLAANFLLYSSFFRIRPDGPDFPPSRATVFDYGTKDGYQFFLQHGPNLRDIGELIHNPLFDSAVAHNTYDDYWQARDISQHLNGVRCAVLNVAGWYDAEDLAGPFRAYRAIEQRNPGIENVLVVGPWEHGAWIRSRRNSPEHLEFEAAEYYREHILFPFFEHHLKGLGESRLPEVTIFETSTNIWREYDSWPPKEAQPKTLYLHANGKLSFDPPGSGEAPYDQYPSDPEHPVPFMSYATTDLAPKYMFGDQFFASQRKDVLTYVSDPLQEDITLVGAVSPRLSISTTGADSDFDVKLIDVFPGEHTSGTYEQQADVPVANEETSGYQQLVRGEPMRAKFRQSFSSPQPMMPNQITTVAFDMPDIDHTFQRGHRIMVQIQSTWFPLTDVNPQTFVDTAKANRSDFVKATERVYHTPQTPSGIAVRLAHGH